MELRNKTALVTGAGGGIGTAIVKALLKRGVKVYAATRNADEQENILEHDPEKAIAVKLDVTSLEDVKTVASKLKDVSILINNAGVNFGACLSSENCLDAVRKEMEVNFFGVLNMCREFIPVIKGNGQGAIVNVSSIIGMVAMPSNSTYCASKAALHSLTQSVRGELASSDILVTGVYPGPVDTSMTAGVDMPKASVEDVAEAIVEGLENDVEDIFPDEMSAGLYELIKADCKKAEKELSVYS